MPGTRNAEKRTYQDNREFAPRHAAEALQRSQSIKQSSVEASGAARILILIELILLYSLVRSSV